MSDRYDPWLENWMAERMSNEALVESGLAEIIKALPPAPEDDAAGFIYVIQGLPGTPVKIGFTSHDDVRLRLSSLQTGNPHRLSVIAKVKGCMADERAIHRALADDRLCGEWFTLSTRVQRLLDRIAKRPKVADLIETTRSEILPDCPSEWETMEASEQAAERLFSIKAGTLRAARREGKGSPHTERPYGGDTRRFYLIGPLKRWLVARQIPHAIDRKMWTRVSAAKA